MRRLAGSTFATLVMFALLACPLPARGQSSMGLIDGSSELLGVRGVMVPPVRRTETSSLADLGTIETDGYTEIVVNLAGQMVAVDEAGGTVGVVLIPDISPFDKAFSGMGLLPASLEISLAVASRTNTYFMAPQQKFDVGFPRYRALAYNNTHSAVTISFFVYRTKR